MRCRIAPEKHVFIAKPHRRIELRPGLYGRPALPLYKKGWLCKAAGEIRTPDILRTGKAHYRAVLQRQKKSGGFLFERKPPLG